VSEPVWSETNEHRSGVDLEQAEVIGGHLVRFTVHHDRFIAPQSWAKAETWRPADVSWQPLATLHAHRWALHREEGAQRGLDGLRAKAVAILGTDEPEDPFYDMITSHREQQ
jgi:hypothetical protein